MNTSIPYNSRLPNAIDVESKTVKTRSAATKFSFVIYLLLFFISAYAVTSWFSIDSLKKDQAEKTAQISSLNTQVENFKAKTKSTDALRRELSDAKGALSTEIAKKSALAVENTRLKGRITQGERDLAQALEKLKVYEKPKKKKK